MINEIKRAVEQGFHGKSVVVIGDFMLDKYLVGNINRVSPEAPVPVVELTEEKYTLGGAGNVALNLKGLGITVYPVSVIGDDTEAEIIKDILDENRISQGNMFVSSEKPTITKTRIAGEQQQIVRVDKEDKQEVGPCLQTKIMEEFKKVLQNRSIDSVILSDYAKGTISDEMCRFIIQKSNERKIPVLVDPKGKDFSRYKNATFLVPNEQEFMLAFGEDFRDDESLKNHAKKLQQKLNLSHFVITRGEKGMLLVNEGQSYAILSSAREVYDVSGAGDTVIALTAAGLALGLRAKETLKLANIAAGYVVSKFGTHPISYDELNNLIHRYWVNGQKVFDKKTIRGRLNYWRNNRQKIVFTNGCFDIIHAGHIHLLQKAKQQGDRLIVAVNTDDTVRRLKGEERPINNLGDRICVLKAISYVDAVIPFSEPTPLRLIQQIKPDVLVKGSDYQEHEIVGAKEVKAEGGDVVRIPLVGDKSTTRLITQVLAMNE
jgi:D-beta-D-heptose 7-phosphate kinase/D-beta-D-heptose 1-phosphate adenosyltransferase